MPDQRSYRRQHGDDRQFVHARKRRVHLVHGTRPCAPLDRRGHRLAGSRARLGGSGRPRRPDLPADALAPPAHRRVPVPRHRPPVGLRPAFRPELAPEPDHRSLARHAGRGARGRAPRGDGRLRPGPPAVGGHPGRRHGGRRGGADHQAPPLPVRRRGRHAHAGHRGRPAARTRRPGRDAAGAAVRDRGPAHPDHRHRRLDGRARRWAWPGAEPEQRSRPGSATPATPSATSAAPSAWPVPSTGRPRRIAAPCHPSCGSGRRPVISP